VAASAVVDAQEVERRAVQPAGVALEARPVSTVS